LTLNLGSTSTLPRVPELLISELARRSGFPSSALRYYERVGLLSPVGRSSGGYRVYDDRAVKRLAFIARAKRLGLNLDEIKDLVGLWEDGPCRPVQTRLRSLVDDKVTLLESQIDELARFHAQLAHVRRSLASAEPADRCGPGCGCDAELPDDDDIPVSFGRTGVRADESDDVIACTLGAADAASRLQEWQSVLDLVEERQPTSDGVALRFPRDAELLGALAALTVREVDCCSFFTFTLTLDADAAWLAVSAPPDAKPMIAEMFHGA